jgi:hypothetical protein
VSLEDECKAFLGALKTADAPSAWTAKRHVDYAECRVPVSTASGTLVEGDLVMTAHMSRSPQKLGFTLVHRGQRVLGLDVEPGLTHFNAKTKTVVRGTHWQDLSGDAEADSRSMDFAGWLAEFCARANLSLRHPCTPPPAIQPPLPFD